MEGNLRTRAMGILPHTDIDAALEMSLSLDIPFRPQLPKVSFYEDMYAQMSEGFPRQSLLAPATCRLLREMSHTLRRKYGLEGT